jgi:pyruvate/2-oxoglutarate dehydrogenase complex dihydrolipoamide acyltransferase (E2) component
MTQVDVRAPAEQTEGTRSQILRWLKQVGDAVAENEPLIEIETDKVTVEVAAPAAGTLAGSAPENCSATSARLPARQPSHALPPRQPRPVRSPRPGQACPSRRPVRAAP